LVFAPLKRRQYVDDVVNRVILKDSGHTHTTDEFTLAPHIHQLSLRLNHQVFQNKSVAGIIRQIFETAKIPSESCQISGGGNTRVYCTQYGDTTNKRTAYYHPGLYQD